MRVLGFNPPIVHYHMSLINDALKKAQKQRTGENAPDVSVTSPEGEVIGRIVKRDKPPAFSTLLIRIGLSASALLILLIGAYLGLQRLRQPTFQPAEPKPIPAPAISPSPPPVVETTQAPETFSIPIPPSAPPVVTSPPPPPPPPPRAKFSPKAINFIDNLRIAGIRASATDSKVLMNDRVYRNGDIVEYELGLKLIEITANSLTFENESGARYTRNF